VSDKKITELNNITSANLSDVDEFVVVDISGDETKAITYNELKQFNGAISSDGLTVNGDIAATGGDLNLDTLDLNAIAESKAVTAVDVFVYDTSKDSDGGAWRKRTQGTSWYNETLNTATRGSRKEFPAVAVIVAEATKVTIYDGDDPVLPMWMVANRFSGSGYSWIGFNITSTATAVSMLNGVLCVGSTDSASNFRPGLAVIDFGADSAVLILEPADPKDLKTISERNVGANLAKSGDVRRLVNSYVNDVTMTVLPDAPIDSATGLPVPTIAVATNGGLSVINNDGTVADSATVDGTPTAVVTAEDGFWFTTSSGSRLYYTTFADAGSDGFGDIVGDTDGVTGDFTSLTLTESMAYNLGLLASGGTFDSQLSVAGLMLHQPNHTDLTKGMSTLITDEFNTGWMNGDIKGAFLSDTDDTDLVESGELVTNGTFDTDTTGWSVETGDETLSVVSGRLRVTFGADGAAGTASGAYQLITGLTPGKLYSLFIGARYVGTNGAVGVNLQQVIGSVSLVNIYGFTDATNESETFTAAGTTVWLRVYGGYGTAGTYVEADNISIKLADEDRSVNNNGLIVNGTVTRTAVATGADLVAYSGFSASNYLEQQYNSDLDFGTGDFCVMGWASFTSTGSQVLLSRTAISGGSRTGASFQISNSSDSFIFDITDDGYASFDRAEVPFANNTGVMQHICCLRSGSNTYIYVNGVLAVTKAIVNAAGSLSNATATLTVGAYPTGTVIGQFPWGGSFALLRISATVPTASQIAKMYNDEKVLFQENAQATLYGTSDAVTAVAHDSDTNLLHVGTSDGRSVFQGLRRVSNTTTAVGTAISASNGLVVEE